MRQLKRIGLVAIPLLCQLANASEFIDLAKQHTFNQVSQNQLHPLYSKTFNQVKHTRYQQVLNGFPIFGHHILKHEQNSQSHYTGHWLQLSDSEQRSLNTVVNLSHREAQQIALKQFLENHPQYQKTDVKHHQETLMYYQESAQKIRLAYFVNFFIDTAAGEPARPYALIDAETGELLLQWNGLTKKAFALGPGGNEKVGKYRYGQEFCALEVIESEDHTMCFLENDYAMTINMENGTEERDVFQFFCPLQNHDSVNGAYSPMNDAHHFASVTYKMFKFRYNQFPLDHKVRLRVHYGQNYSGAFWDGLGMSFGDGNDNYFPFTTMDLVAHEIAHGFTEKHSQLQWWGQSGAINESFSDMAGQATEYFARMHNTWHIGEDVLKHGDALQYMDQPTRDGYSIDHTKDYKGDKRQSYFANGIFNKAFYLLSTSPGWHTQKAFDVMVDANRFYWEPMVTFDEAAEGVLRAAKDLGYDSTHIVNAFKQVGIYCQMTAHHGDYNCQVNNPE